jgi:hypothetical protein
MTNGEIIIELAGRFTSDAAEYLRTGVKPERVTTFGGEPTLTPNDRAVLDAVREDISVVPVSQIRKFLREDIDLGQFGRFFRDLKERDQQFRTPSRDRPPTGPLPEGQQYVFNNQRGQWTIMEGYKTVAVVDQAGKVIQQIREPEDTTDSGLVSSTRISAGTGDIEPGEMSRPAPPEDGAEPAAEPAGEGDGVVTTPAAEPVDMGVPPEWETAAMEMYPEYYALVKNVPEIADILKKYIAEEWSETKFLAELRKTNWYKTTTASAREWDMAAGLDPATYQTKVDNKTETIRKQALDLGFRISEEKLRQLATDSLRLGWSDQFLTNAIGMVVVEGGDPGATQLRQGYYGQQIRGIARDYGVTLNDDTLMSFANKMAVGEETVGSFQDYAMTIAKSLYPTLSEQFDLGRTFGDLTSNYRQIAANTLEIDANSIDFTDPQWAVAVTYQPDPKTGEQRMMNLSEWGDYIRKNRSFGYEYTDDAKQKAYKVANELANLFGKV